MVNSISTIEKVEKEILTTNEKEKTDKNCIQLINFLAQEPPTPVDWSFFETKKKQNPKKVVDKRKKL